MLLTGFDFKYLNILYVAIHIPNNNLNPLAVNKGRPSKVRVVSHKLSRSQRLIEFFQCEWPIVFMRSCCRLVFKS